MKKMRFSLKLALSGMRKNGKLYLPYLLTCIGMVAMGYILESIAVCPLLEQMKGGVTLQMALSPGKIVVAVFTAILLLYCSSFLLQRRKKEFGLYHILGMGKQGIRRIVFWEAISCGVIGLLGGLAGGILFSKLAELVLARILQKEASYSFTLKWEAVRWILLVYGCIFLLLLVRELIAVQCMKTLELFQSERVGEKPPKANWLIALIGLVILGVAYGIAVSVESPLKAMMYFFLAVIMVIVATYLLFIAGSVVFCRILQKNKKYYYQKQHFVSVSSMVYRMKRNGAGLASICILSTMVLVMLSASGSLYFGMEDMMDKRFPREISIEISGESLAALSRENIEQGKDALLQVVGEHGLETGDAVGYSYAALAVMIQGEELLYLSDVYSDQNFSNLRQLMFMEAADYNRITGDELHPVENEAYVLPYNCSFEREGLPFGDVTFQVKGVLAADIPLQESICTSVIPAWIVVIEDLDTLAHQEQEGELSRGFWFGLNLPGATQEQILAVYTDQRSRLTELDCFRNALSYSTSCKAAERDEFIDIFGGLFFLGIILSIIFVAATVLIIYYKQITEGYEDQSQFTIMQKVGMTKGDIKKSISSQVLTVFAAPLLMAGIHLIFAYPMIWKMLKIFYMDNLGFVILVTAGIYLCFGISYGIVYKLTAGAYYNIVSGENG